MKQLYCSYKAQFKLRKLKRLGYFELTPNEKLNHSQEIILRHLKHRGGIKQMWGFGEELEFDYRSFLIQEDSKNDGVELNWKKWNQVLMSIGLNFSIKENKEMADKEDKEIQEININNNQYFIIKDNNDENLRGKSFLKFSEIVNKELEKIGSRERTQLYGEYPTRILILNEELKETIYLNEQLKTSQKING